MRLPKVFVTNGIKQFTVRHGLVPDWFLLMHQRKEHEQWEARGRTPPTSSKFKQEIVRSQASMNHLQVLVESGTYYGSMVSACLHDFTAIFSIELQESFFLRAKRKFAPHPHVSVIYGDSSTELHTLLKSVERPCLFWLDAHYSAGLTARGPLETPIMRELEAIFAHQIGGHLILIDDARCFEGTHDYPTLSEVAEYASAQGWSCEVKDDVIRLAER